VHEDIMLSAVHPSVRASRVVG